MKIAKFWEYMPEDVYNQWQRNKFVAAATEAIQSGAVEGAMHPPPELQDLGRNPFATPLTPGMAEGGMVIPGAGLGGFFSRAKKKIADAFGLVDDVTQPVRSAADWYTRNVTDPIGGYAQSVGGYRPFLQPGHDVAFRLAEGERNPLRLLGQQPFEWEPEYLRNTWSESGEAYRDTPMTGLERFGGGIAYDPLTYAGFYGKGIGLVPGLGKVGKGVSALEALPGKGVGGGLDALTSLYSGSRLAQPSVSGRATIAGRAGVNYAAELIDEANKLGVSPAELMTRRVSGTERLTALSPMAPNMSIPRESSALRAALDEQFGEGGLGLVRGALKQPDEGGPLTTEQLLANVYDVTRRQKLGDINKEIQAGREGSRIGALQNFGDAFVRPIRSATGALGRASIGTPAFPIQNITEDAARAGIRTGQIGRMSPEQFRAAVPHDPRVPAEFSAGLQSTSYGTGAEKLGPGLGGFHPLDIATGQPFVRASGRWSEPVRAKAFSDLYQEGVKKGLDEDGAITFALKEMEKTFPSQAIESKLGAAAKVIDPFWGYHSHRIPYLTRTAVEHPQMLAAMNAYEQNTDRGYIDLGAAGIPGSFQPNLLRGTVFGSHQAAARPDYPSHAQGIAGDLENIEEQVGKLGFRGGLPVQAGQLAVRAMTDQPLELGGLVPQTVQYPMNIAAGTGQLMDNPLSQGAVNLQGAFDNRFRDYAIRKELAMMGVKPEEATPEQKMEASQRAAAVQATMTTAGMLRHRPEAQREYEEAMKAEALRAGVPADVVAKSLRPLSAIDPATNQPYLNAAEKRGIFERNPSWEPWQQVSEPLRTKEEQQRLDDIRGYYGKVDQINAEMEAELKLLYQGVRNGEVSGQQFRDRRSDIMSKANNRRQQARTDFPGAEISLDKTKREEYYRRTGRAVSAPTAEDEAAQRYFEVRPEVNQRTGLVDFDTFRQQREGILASFDPQTRDYVLNQYQRKQFKDPEVAQAESGYERLQQGPMNQYFGIPKYLGLDEAQAQQIDDVLAQATLLQRMNPGMSRDQAFGILYKSNPQAVILASQAEERRNPARRQFMSQNPDLAWLFGSASDVPGMETPF